MKLYQVSIGLVFMTDDGLRERGLDIVFEESSDERAILAGLRWLKNRSAAMDKLQGTKHTPGSVKVYTYHAGRPEEDGHISTGSGGRLYEWKMDFPGKLDDEIKLAEKKARG